VIVTAMSAFYIDTMAAGNVLTQKSLLGDDLLYPSEHCQEIRSVEYLRTTICGYICL